MKKTKKKISPSRKRYVEAHPTVSARLPLEIRQKLMTNLKTMTITLPDAFKILAGELEIKARPVEATWQKGYQQGFKTAREKYQVIYSCTKCGTLLTVSTPEEKDAIKQFMKEAGWCHSDCTQS